LKKPRIAFLLQMFGIGGMPKWLYQIASQLKDDFDFYFIATHSSYIRPEYRDVAQIAVLPFNKWRIATYLAIHRIDIAQVANLVRYKKAAQIARVPIIIERTDGLRGGAALNSKDGLDAVICSTSSVANQVREMIASEKVHVIYNGFDLSTYDGVGPERFGFADSDIIIGRTSRLAAGKNISLLIKAVIELRKNPKFQHVRLVICGGDNTQQGAPPMQDQLKSEALPLKESIVFTGEVFDTRAITLGFDIATCTSNSKNEGIPNSLIEAMAAGKPIVATRVDDIPELVEDGNAGILVAENDLDELVEALNILILTKEIRNNFGSAGQKKIRNEFEMAVQITKYEELYRQLLSA
jgi:glycosyltransferase involved in cell wall biosynthesis